MYIYLALYIFLYVCMHTKWFHFSLSLQVVFLLISRWKRRNKSNAVLGGNGVHISCLTATANKMATVSGDR